MSEKNSSRLEIIALTDTFEFLKEQDPKDLKNNKIQIFASF